MWGEIISVSLPTGTREVNQHTAIRKEANSQRSNIPKMVWKVKETWNAYKLQEQN